MKVLIAFVSAFFFLVSFANAAPPKFVDTAAYKDLVVYVDNLDSLKTTPASAEAKSSYQTNLDEKASLAKTRANQLLDQRKAFKKKELDNRLKANYRSYDLKYLRQAKAIEKDLKIDLKRTSILEKDKLAEVGRSYRAAKKKLTASLLNLRDRYYSSQNAEARTALQNKINQTITKINQIEARQDRAAKAVEDRFLKAENRLKQNAALNKKRAYQVVSQKKRKLKRSSDRSYNAAVKNYQVSRNNEYVLVNNLKTEGEGYISQMPAPLT